MSRSFPILIAVVVLAGLVRAEDPPPPKVRRTYGERVKLHEATPSEAKPDAKSTVRLPADTAPAGGSDRLSDQLSPNSLPAMLPPPPKSPGEDKGKPWSMLDKPEESKPSGWGWLADDILRMTQSTSAETRVQGEDGEDGETRSEDGLGRETEPASDPASGEVNPVDEEALVKARLEEAGESSNPGWQPVERRREAAGWTPAAEGLSPRSGSPAADLVESPAFLGASPLESVSGLAPTAFRPAELVPARVDAAADDRVTRELQSRSLFTPGEAAGETRFGVPARPTTLDPSPFTPAAASVGGFPASGTPAPIFGTLGALDLQPTLSVPAPVSPALELPSLAPSTPSLGGMGNEMEARPKTLPW